MVKVRQVTKCIFVTSLFCGIVELFGLIVRAALETVVLNQLFFFFFSLPPAVEL